MKLTRLSTGVMAGLLALAAACDSGDGNGDGEGVLERLVLAPQNQTLAEGGSLQLNATAIWDTGRSENVTFDVAWSSSDTNVIDLEGARLNAVGPGESVIEARYEGLTASTSVFVDAAVQEVLISPPELTLKADTGGSASATGIASDGSKRSVNSQVAWASSNQDVAEVDGAGNITAGEAGTSTISASQGGTVIGEVEVTVTDSAVADLAVVAPNEDMLVGTSQPLIVTGELEDGHTQALPLAWEVTAESPAGEEGPVLDPDALASGALVALQTGTATVQGKFVVGEETLATSNEVSVNVLDAGLKPDSITVNAPGSVAVEGQPIFLGATGEFAGAGTFNIGSLVFWQGSDDEVLRLRGPQGTPRSAGTVTVNAVWPVEEGDAIVGAADIQVVDTAISGLTIDAENEPALRAVASFGSTEQDVTSATLWSTQGNCSFVDNAPSRSGQVTVLEAGCEDEITAKYKGAEATFTLTP